MTTTDKRTPLDSTISEIHRMIDSISGRLDTIAAAVDSMRVCPMHEPGDPDCRPSHGGACRPPVDMLAAPDDPLHAYRLPSGRVAYAEEAARWVQVGDWVQAVHGDEERWEEVVGTVHTETQTGLTTRSGDPRYGSITRLRWWGHDDKVRVATVNCHIDEDTPVSAGQLSASGTWTVDIGGGDDMVILFASADRMRRLAHEILDAIPAEGEGIDHARAACPYPAGCTGCVPEEHLEPCGCPTDLVADCGHQEGCERDGFDEPTLVDGGIVL